MEQLKSFIKKRKKLLLLLLAIILFFLGSFSVYYLLNRDSRNADRSNEDSQSEEVEEQSDSGVLQSGDGEGEEEGRVDDEGSPTGTTGGTTTGGGTGTSVPTTKPPAPTEPPAPSRQSVIVVGTITDKSKSEFYSFSKEECNKASESCMVYLVLKTDVKVEFVRGFRYVLSFDTLGECTAASGTTYCEVEGDVQVVKTYLNALGYQAEPDPENYYAFQWTNCVDRVADDGNCYVFMVKKSVLTIPVVVGQKYQILFDRLGECTAAAGTTYCYVEGNIEVIAPL